MAKNSRRSANNKNDQYEFNADSPKNEDTTRKMKTKKGKKKKKRPSKIVE